MNDILLFVGLLIVFKSAYMTICYLEDSWWREEGGL